MTDAHPHFAVEAVVSDGVLTVIPAGELDMAAAPELAAAIAGTGTEGEGAIVIDLRRVTFIDSSGLQALLSAHRDCLARGKEMRVVRGPENVHRLFEITGMGETLPFVDPGGDVDGGGPERAQSTLG